MPEAVLPNEAAPRLAMYFHRNGYVRRFDPKRRKEEGQLYKKGVEVRLVAETKAELGEIRRLLRQLKFKVAKSFQKANQWRQPIYGVEAVQRFLDLVGDPPSSEVASSSAPTS